MTEDDIKSVAIGRLERIKYYLEPSFHAEIDDLIERLVTISETRSK